MGWTKARELVKVARKEGAEFICAPWVHKAMQLPKEQFKREVERHLTGKKTEAWEIRRFCISRSTKVSWELLKNLETAALMLGSDKSRGYDLEMICADFLAGCRLRGASREMTLALSRANLVQSLELVRSLERLWGELRQKIPRLKLRLAEYKELRIQVLKRDGWRCQLCGKSRDLHVHHLKLRSNLGDDTMRNVITLCSERHQSLHHQSHFSTDG
jgi:hypothetical protein